MRATTLAAVLTLAAFGAAGSAAAADYAPAGYKYVTTTEYKTVYETKKVPYTKEVTKYNSYGKPYTATVTAYREVEVPVKKAYTVKKLVKSSYGY